MNGNQDNLVNELFSKGNKMYSIEEIKQASKILDSRFFRDAVLEAKKILFPGYSYNGFSPDENGICFHLEEYLGAGEYRPENFLVPVEGIFDTKLGLAHVKTVRAEQKEKARIEKEQEEKEREENRKNKLISDFNAAKEALEKAGLSV